MRDAGDRGRRRCSAREHCTGAPIPNMALYFLAGERRLQLALSKLPPGNMRLNSHLSESERCEIFPYICQPPFSTAIVPIALRLPYDLQGTRPDRPRVTLRIIRQSPRTPSDRPRNYKVIAPIALRSPYDLQGNRPDRPPIAPSVEEGDRDPYSRIAPIAQLHPVWPLKF